MVEHDSIPPGTSIDGYVVEARLGAGGFGRVYRAVAPDGERVAIKLARTPSEQLSAPFLRLQQNELEALIELRHPGLVQVRRFGVFEGFVYIAMELASGESLSSYVARRGRLDPVEAIAFGTSVADALAACHQRGILHLDLKPDHVIVSDATASRIKIVDFGLAHLEGGWRGERDRVAGTPEYMAPECFEPCVPEATADLYSLGVILYVLLTGKVPFGMRSMSALRSAKIVGEYVPIAERVANVPEALIKLIERLLDPNPSRRPATAVAVAEQLRAMYFHVLSGRTADARHLPRPIAHNLDVGGGTFVGRAMELEWLEAAWESVESGENASVLVRGAAGLGKSRLVLEVLESAPRKRGLVAYGRCRQHQAFVAYAPIREALGDLLEAQRSAPRAQQEQIREALRAALGQWASLLVGLMPDLADQLHDVETESPQTAGPIAVGRAVAAYVASLTEYAPVAIAFEDLHWSDPAVLDAIGELCRIRIPGVMVIATSREPLPWPTSVEKMELLPLSEADNEALLASLLPGASAEILERLRTTVPLLRFGSPLVDAQIVRALEVQGSVIRDANGRVAIDGRALADYQAPQSLRAVLERSIDHLDVRDRQVMQVAALFGRSFSIPDLAAVLDRQQVERAVLAAHRLGLVGVRGEHCAFGHDAIFERLASEVPAPQRREWHARIAEQLRRVSGAPAELAYHLELADLLDEAARRHHEAALCAEWYHDPRAAAYHHQRVLELAPNLPRTPERDEMVRRTIHELMRGGAQTKSAEQAVAELEAAAKLLDEDVARRDPVISGAHARLEYLRGDFSAALEYCREAQAAAFESGLGARYQGLAVDLEGWVLAATGNFAQAAALLEKSTDAQVGHKDPREIATSRGVLALSLGFMGEVGRARQMSDEVAALAEEIGDPGRMLGALCYASLVGEYGYDWKAGMMISAEALEFADRHELGGLYRYLALMFAGRHQFHVGQLERARVLLEGSLTMAEDLGIGIGIGWGLAYLGDVFFVEGNLEQARLCYDAGLECSSGDMPDEYGAPLCLLGRAHIDAMVGGPRLRASVEAEASEAIRRLDAAGNRATRISALQRMAEAIELVAGPRVARPLREQAEREFGRLGITPVEWWPLPPGKMAEYAPNNRTYWTARASQARAAAELRLAEGEPSTRERSELRSDLPATRALNEASKAVAALLGRDGGRAIGVR